MMQTRSMIFYLKFLNVHHVSSSQIAGLCFRLYLHKNTMNASHFLAIVGGALFCCCSPCRALLPRLNNEVLSSLPKAGDKRDAASSRRDFLWKVPIGAVGTYAYGRLVYNALAVNGNKYPPVHDDRVASTVARTLTTAATGKYNDPLRVLEVGIGTEARLIQRGLYDPAIRQLSETITKVDLVGLDLRLPSARVRNAAEAKLNLLGQNEGVGMSFQLVDGSITTRLPFNDGYFDAIVCCLTLCSVDDPEAAVREMRRLLRPEGGTLGYVEHVAVDINDKSHRFLDWQQQLLDPFQQLLVDNCHLHRFTENTISSVLGVDSNEARLLQEERFFVDSMWPVSCQACGVVQRI